MPDETTEPRPLLTVVRGQPTPEQLAALLAVVAARASGGSADDPPGDAEPPLWAAPVLRGQVHPGPGAWRASGLPVR